MKGNWKKKFGSYKRFSILILLTLKSKITNTKAVADRTNQNYVDKVY